MSTVPSAYTPFSVAVVPNRAEVGVVVAGDLDLATAEAVAEAVSEAWTAGFHDVVLDLTRVGFIDSTALRMLLHLRNTAKREGFGLAVVPAQPGAQRIFTLTATHGLFDWRTRFPA